LLFIRQKQVFFMRVSFLQLFSGKSIGGFVFLSGGIRNITLVKRFFHLGEASSSLW
jgi:hypothetical protein